MVASSPYRPPARASISRGRSAAAPWRRRPRPDRGRSPRSPPRSARAGPGSPRSASAPASGRRRRDIRSDVDDAAGVDDIIGRVEDAALRASRCAVLAASPAGCWRRRRRSARSSAAIDCSVEDRAERARADHVGFERQDLVRRRRPCRRSRRRASCARAASTSAIDSRAPSAAAWRATPPATLPAPCSAMCSPSRLSLPSARFTAALMPRNTPSDVCGPGSPPTRRLRPGRPATNLVWRRNLDHVGDAHADVLGGDVAAAERVDRLAEGVRASRASWCASASARMTALPPPSGKPGHRILVAHPARQAQRVGQRVARHRHNARSARRPPPGRDGSNGSR